MFTDPDIAEQLKRIADALNRPSSSATPQWIITLVSFVVGIFSAIAGQFVQNTFVDLRAKKRLRQILYVDIAAALPSILSRRALYTTDKQVDLNSRPLAKTEMDGARHASEHRDTFLELPERKQIETIHSNIQSAQSSVTVGGRDKSFMDAVAVLLTSPAVRAQMKRFVTPEDLKRLYTEAERFKREMMESGAWSNRFPS